jgi:hypothetical protein
MKGSIDKLEKNIDKLLHDLPTFQNWTQSLSTLSNLIFFCIQ